MDREKRADINADKLEEFLKSRYEWMLKWLYPRDRKFTRITIQILFGVVLIISLWTVPYCLVSSIEPVDKSETLIFSYRQAFFSGLILAIGLYVAWKRSMAHSEQAEAQLKQSEVQHESQITERFTRAVEQLGSEKVAICLGGIYALRRVAKDSPADFPQVMELLTAFVRENCPTKKETIFGKGIAEEEKEKSPTEPRRDGEISIAIQAVLSVVDRNNWPGNEAVKLDFSDSHLQGANFLSMNFRDTKFGWSNLVGATLISSDFQNAFFRGANLEDACLIAAKLQEAELNEANLKRADLHGAFLQNAILERADLQDANLENAYLENAYLKGTNLKGVNLKGANLARANLQDVNLASLNLEDVVLEGANLEGTEINTETKFPKNLKIFYDWVSENKAFFLRIEI